MRPSLCILLAACADPRHAPIDPATAPRVAIDRFSDQAGTVFRRSVRATLPGPDQPIDYDRDPFLVRALGPAGEPVEYTTSTSAPAWPSRSACCTGRATARASGRARS